jgi:hypothetical protein
MTSTIHAREVAKSAVKDALAAHRGDTTDPVVAAAIAQLVQLNPTPAPARCDALMDGNWLLISAPNFPNREQRSDGTPVYTLGRLAFNLFQPTQLKLVIDRVLQPVLPIEGGPQRTHDIVVEFTTIDETLPTLQGIVHNTGICHAIDDTTLQVQFTGGSLMPKSSPPSDAWAAVFGNPVESSRLSLTDQIMSRLIKLLFGIVPSPGMERHTGQISFTMQRSPKGKLKLLYLDEEWRITQGERGTVLVCERL